MNKSYHVIGRRGMQKKSNGTQSHVKKNTTLPSFNLGLNDEEVAESRKKYGANTFTPKKKAGFFRRFLSNLNDPIIKILIVALVINTAFTFSSSNKAECIGIAMTVLISAFVTTLSEYSSGKAFDALYSKLDEKAIRVIRGGKITEIPASELVRHDILLVSSGDTVPADGILVKGRLSCDQSPLTGESRKVDKIPSSSALTSYKSSAGDFTLSPDSPSAVLKGSRISEAVDDATILVTSVGEKTLYGSIAGELSEEDTVSPLKERLTSLAKTISKIGYCSAIIVAAVHLIDAFWLEAGKNPTVALALLSDIKYSFPELIRALTMAISVVVVAVPEGLPMMITVVLSSNMKRMLKSNVLVRRLVGIETAGNLSILFTDKTGTLTTGKLSISGVITAENSELPTKTALKLSAAPIFESLNKNSSATSSAKNSTENAVEKFLDSREKMTPREKHIPFDSERKFAAGVIDGKLYIRGAAEFILPRCTMYLGDDGKARYMTKDILDRIRKNISLKTAEKNRILLAAEGGAEIFDKILRNGLSLDTPLTFTAIYVIHDEIRREAASAVKECQSAGIQVVMITGDNRDTAKNIAAECGIIPKNGEIFEKRYGIESYINRKIPLVLDGEELHTLSDEEVKMILPQIRVISRSTPTDKSRLIKISKAVGHTVGMTGDGINDSPALKSADVGFAMGSGSDVAREAADIVITDDNFVSITKAILYGRTIFKSIRKFITFQLTMNMAAVGVSILGTVFGIDSPVTVIQMLWVNIIMDTLGAIAFAGERAISEYMHEPPVKRDEHILTPSMVVEIIYTAIFAIIVSMVFLVNQDIRFSLGGDNLTHLTRFFALFIFLGIAIAFTTRTSHLSIFANLSKNRAFILIMPTVAAIQLLIIYFGGETFRCTPLDMDDLLICAALSLSVIPADLIRKSVRELLKNKK